MKLLITLGLLLAIVLPSFADNTLNVGSKKFTESYILGEIITQVANKTGEAKAVHHQGLGGTDIVLAALQSGSIDIYAEYTGTISEEILKNKKLVSLDDINRQLATQGLGASVLLGFNDTYAFAMRGDQATKLGINTMSDLAKHPELKVALSHEFLTRPDGWLGVKKAYDYRGFDPQAIDHGLAYEAIGGGQIDVTDIYSTDAKIEKYHLRVLKDDRQFFPAYAAVLLYRLDLPKRLPKTWAALQGLEGKIPDERMIELNAGPDLHSQSFASAAAGFVENDLEGKVASGGTAAPDSFLSRLFDSHFGEETGRHLMLVFVSLSLSILVGIPLGILAARSPGTASPILSVVGVIQTIPSLALLAFLIPVFHQIGIVPALVALFLYALLPIVRNTYTGLTDIAPSLRESAVALGLPSFARLRLIEMPLASRSILAGIKTSAVINVGTATIAAFIGAGGYGDRIVSGLATNDSVTLLTGALPAAVLALLVQGGFDLLDKWIIPAGLRVRV